MNAEPLKIICMGKHVPISICVAQEVEEWPSAAYYSSASSFYFLVRSERIFGSVLPFMFCVLLYGLCFFQTGNSNTVLLLASEFDSLSIEIAVWNKWKKCIQCSSYSVIQMECSISEIVGISFIAFFDSIYSIIDVIVKDGCTLHLQIIVRV